MSDNRLGRYVLYLTVVPFYRQYCIDEMQRQLDNSVALFAGDQHSDRSVRTGIRDTQYRRVRNRFFLGRRVFIQTGHWREALAAETAIFDLNPRNLSAWLLTLARRVRGRRTLLWGHLYPRIGKESPTSHLRRMLRLLADGTVLYGYDSVAEAKQDLPKMPIWVAPNAIYPMRILSEAPVQKPRNRLIYVGRLVTEKKVDLLIRGHARSRAATDGCVLTIVGAGRAAAQLQSLVDELGCADSVDFTGPVVEAGELRHLYAEAFRAVSPGYAGLSLTQSLGFGVPVLVADQEPHSPEIELSRFGSVTYFASDDAGALAEAIDAAWLQRAQFDPASVQEPVRNLYSAEAMAAGLVHALNGVAAETGENGWSQRSTPL